jgi:MFS family permease
MSEFGLDAADMGLLASVYFLFFAAAQIPIGVLLDRFGPRRVQGVLLVIAAGGATLFGTASGFAELLVARAMIGLGVAGALMAGLKAIIVWFPKERVALVNGLMIMLGSLGAATATAPAEWLLDRMDWRGLFELLTFAIVAAAGLIYFIVPECAGNSASARQGLTLRAIYSDWRFWRIAPLSATCIGSSWALQSLWAARWLTDVEALERPNVVTQLFMMAIGISVGALLLGAAADRLRRRGIQAEVLFATVAVLFVAAQLALVLRLPLPSLVPWSIVPVVGAATVLSYAMIADCFPAELAARANGALNLLHFSWAFAVQYGVGLVIGQWLPQDGHYPAIAYQTAFSLCLAFQIMALIWFAVPWLRTLSRRLYASSPPQHVDSDSFAAVMPAEGGILETCESAEW